ncbi:MAG: N-acetylmuramoyl-L-alanine amidase [Akkermansiaceae bacterium]|jgi:N-acetylmuramoyl-L-alanine amidase
MSLGKVTTPFRRLVALPILLIVFALIFWPKKIPLPPASPLPVIELADLIPPPDWSQLDQFQNIVSKETFLERLTTVYTKSDAWKQWIRVEDNHAQIGAYRLQFSPSDKPAPGALWNWKSTPTSSANPLTGLHIAIDPGHIGGDYAKLEERHHEYPGIPPIQEGTMTLKTAQLLKPLLEQQGARVTLVRDQLEPLTPYSPDNFNNPVLFYRTSEIRARARLVNETIQPDLVLCLHYNGTASKTPIPGQHFHIILNGTYAPGELANEDERFGMLQRILSGVITEEVPLAARIADVFSKATKLPPYTYPSFSTTSQNVENNPFLWARNLLANRLYLCPVIFMEPYVMNSTEFVARFQADPDALYREYAQAVAEGIISYYTHKS